MHQKGTLHVHWLNWGSFDLKDEFEKQNKTTVSYLLQYMIVLWMLVEIDFHQKYLLKKHLF